MARALLRDVVLKHFSNDSLNALGDAAVLDAPAGRLAFTTDSFVVNPLFFPGGDIGKLAVCGTINDLAVSGAQPLTMSCSLIIEEGFLIRNLEKILVSMSRTLQQAGIRIVTGDTKVVERGAAQGIFINTAGIGAVQNPIPSGAHTVQPGDSVLVSGPIGDHGTAVMACREGLEFQGDLRSDCAPLHSLARALLNTAPHTRFMRDATRGGLAAVLHELCENQAWGVELDETLIPVRPQVAALCEMLGLDPLHAANEGTLAAVVPADQAPAALAAVQAHEHGCGAALIGRISTQYPARVCLRTSIGGLRIVDAPSGEQFPRIC
jgi:hydrogenase expression/formation protein HypE